MPFQFSGSSEPERCNQPPMLRCFAGVESLTHHIATVPSVRNAGDRESKALQVEPLGLGPLEGGI